MLELNDLFARIGAAELTALINHPDVSNRLLNGISRTLAYEALEHLKTYVFDLPHGAQYGIHSQHISESNRIAFDLMQVIRHRLAWARAGDPPERTAEMYSIAYDPPMATSSEPLAIVREKREPL